MMALESETKFLYSTITKQITTSIVQSTVRKCKCCTSFDLTAIEAI